jgi:xanthine dehydrogenase YagR molybdenum-binding subunit
MGFFDNDIWMSPAEGRVEAEAKVTGKGKYAAEYEVKNVCYGSFVTSTIASGTIKSIHLDEARMADGVLEILTHENRPAVSIFSDEAKAKEARLGLPIFHTKQIYFYGQPIALVVANSIEEASYAASLIRADYERSAFSVDFDKARGTVPLAATGKERGSVDGWSNAQHIVEAEYNIKMEVHNPMEMHATIADWTADDKLTLYDKNQGVNNVQRVMSRFLEIPPANIHVISEFVGGGFGSGLRVWPHVLAAALAAKQVKRPVKLMLTRPQMFNMVGYRPQSWQKIKIGADSNGKFLGIIHQAKHATSLYDNFTEGITRITRLVYNFENLKTESAVVPLNLCTPTPMRGPGDCTGDFAVESAVDELSYVLGEDPVALRLKNLALEKDIDSGKPWSSHFLSECIEMGARMIGWSGRNKKPGEKTEGAWATGYGMAVGMWGAGRNNMSAGISMDREGNIILKTAMTDIGTGTSTAMMNIAQTGTGISSKKIKIELGNSDLPAAPSQGGSTGLSSLSGAVNAAVQALKQKLATYATVLNDVYKNASTNEIILSDTGVSYKNAHEQFIAYADIWKKHELETIDVEASSGPGDERQKYAFCCSAAHFCKVRVNLTTGKVKVDKMVCVADGGTIINEKPAANQMSGAAVGGIGMALMEQQEVDAKLGSLVGNDLAGYHFAVNADVPMIEVAFINKPDPNINPSGAKGLGEVGIIGVAAAISNAIYNACGKRFRDLPITPDKIVGTV